MCWRRCYSLYQCNQYICRPHSSPFVVNDVIHFHISNKSCLRSSKLSAFHFFPCLLSERDTRETKISHTWGIYRERKSSCWIWWGGSSDDHGKKRDCPGEDAIAWTQFTLEHTYVMLHWNGIMKLDWKWPFSRSKDLVKEICLYRHFFFKRP